MKCLHLKLAIARKLPIILINYIFVAVRSPLSGSAELNTPTRILNAFDLSISASELFKGCSGELQT